MDKNKVKVKMEETLSPRKLAYEKYDVYRKYCIGVLQEAIECFQDLDLPKLDEMTFSSPAGDDYGVDSNPINFGFSWNMDALEAMRTLVHLKEIADGEIEPDSCE